MDVLHPISSGSVTKDSWVIMVYNVNMIFALRKGDVSIAPYGGMAYAWMCYMQYLAAV